MLHEPLRAVGRQSTFLHAVQHGGVSCMGVTTSERVCCSNQLPKTYGPTVRSAIGIFTALPTPLYFATGKFRHLPLKTKFSQETIPARNPSPSPVPGLVSTILGPRGPFTLTNPRHPAVVGFRGPPTGSAQVGSALGL